MGLEFDVSTFLHNLKATKPPYECPIVGCARTFRSYPGIANHLSKIHDCDEEDAVATGEEQGRRSRNSAVALTNARNRSPSGSDMGSTAAREALTYAEAQRMIEVEIDGKMHRINITEPISIVKYDRKAVAKGLEELQLDTEISVNSGATLAITAGPASASPNPGKGSKNGVCSRSTNKQKSGKKAHSTNQSKASAKLAAKSPAPEKPKLPEPSFREIDDPIDVPDAEPRGSAYYRFIEKSADELEESVEYDMDEEDTAWLELINKRRKSDKFPPIPPDVFEMLMDRLEKESYFLSQNSKDPVAQAIDENAVCCICNDGDCQNTNAILFCDMCDLAVHQECYGVPYIPEGQWLCRRCLHSPSSAVGCILCPNRGGAFKQTDKGDWAHVVCAIWIPEVCFANTVFLEPIDSIDCIPAARWRLLCYICKQKSVGACIQCHKPNCYIAFHVTCAQSAGLFMKMDFDRTGAQSIRKAAYCHTHTPTDEAHEATALSGVYNTGDSDDENSRTSFKSKKKSKAGGDRSSANESAFKEKIRKTRKILAEKRAETPKISTPTIPMDRLTAIAEKVTLPKRNQFISRLLGYWHLKRKSRNGVPLLRRLQISYMGNRRSESLVTDSEQMKKSREFSRRVQILRQDLEKARLLLEQVRRREKLKKQYVEELEKETMFKMTAYNKFLHHVLEQLEARDTNEYFKFPVTQEDAADYFQFIKHPMDFSTMSSKIDQHLYSNFDAFEDDFKLIIENCKEYNDKTTPYFKAAVKLQQQTENILSTARDTIAATGFNESAGVLLPNSRDEVISQSEPEQRVLAIEAPPPPAAPQIRTSQSTQEESLVSELTGLNSRLDQTYLQKSGGSRSKKIKMLQGQVDDVLKKLHSLNPDQYHPLTEEEKVQEHKRRRSQAGACQSESGDSPYKSSPIKAIAAPDASEDRRKRVSALSESESPKKSPKKVADKKRTHSEPKSNRNKNSIPLSSSISDDVFEFQTSPKKSKSNDSPFFSSGPLPPLFGEHGSKRGRISSSKSSRSRKRSSPVDDAILGTGILPQKDSFKVYRQTAHSSDDSDARSASSSSATSSSRSHSESDQPEEKERRSAVNGFKNMSNPASSSPRLSSDRLTSRKKIQHLDLVWAPTTSKKFPFVPALVVDVDAVDSCPHKLRYHHPPVNIASNPKKGTDCLVHFAFGPLKKTWKWLSSSKLEYLESFDGQKNLPEDQKDRKTLKNSHEKALFWWAKLDEKTCEANNSADLISEESSDENSE